MSVNQQLKRLDMYIGSNINIGHGQNYNYVNQHLSKNTSYYAGAGVYANKFVSNKYSVQVNSSINTAATTRYWTASHSATLALLNIAGFELNSNVNYNWRQKIDDFDKHNSTIL